MKYVIFFFFFFQLFKPAFAQVDTINTATGKLNMAALKEGKSSYLVYFEDSVGNRIGSGNIWDRSIRFGNDGENKTYQFEWKWYMKDSLFATVNATGLLPSLRPLTHKADYVKRGKSAFVFNEGVVTVPDADKKDKKDSAFKVELSMPAFEFPMDLEVFPLLPFKKVNQQFAIAFYEPGSPKADYYNLTVTGKEDLPLPGGGKVNCWLLKIDYKMQGSYAIFWISDTTREVLKMKEEFRRRFRYKVKLY
jgi:hypothetical protein